MWNKAKQKTMQEQDKNWRDQSPDNNGEYFHPILCTMWNLTSHRVCFQSLRQASGGAAGYPRAPGRGQWDRIEVHMSKRRPETGSCHSNQT